MSIKKDFLALVNAWKNDSNSEYILPMINDCMNAFGNYVNRVYVMEYSQPIIYARYEGQEARDKIKDLDTRRRSAHENAIAAVTKCTRWAKEKDIQPMFKGEVTDRYQVASFCEKVVSEFFEGRDQIQRYSLEEFQSEANSTLVQTAEGPMNIDEFKSRVLTGTSDGLLEQESCQRQNEELEIE